MGAEAAEGGNKPKKFFSRSIMLRYMSEKEYNAFLKSYQENLLRTGSRNRFNVMTQDVSEDDKELLRAYFNESYVLTEDVVKAIKYRPGEDPKVSKAKMADEVRTIALRLVYHQQKKLGI